MTDGAPHVRYQLLHAVLPYTNRLGNLHGYKRANAGKPAGTQESTSKTRVCDLIHPVQLGIFAKRVPLPHPDDGIFYLATRKTSRPYETVFHIG